MPAVVGAVSVAGAVVVLVRRRASIGLSAATRVPSARPVEGEVIMHTCCVGNRTGVPPCALARAVLPMQANAMLEDWQEV